MKSVFLLQLQRLRRAPITTVTFFILTIAFVYMLAGGESQGKMSILTFTDYLLSEEIAEEWIERLNASEAFEFQLVEETVARETVSSGNASLAVKLMESDYRLLVATDDPNRYVLEGYVKQVFSEEIQIRELEKLGVSHETVNSYLQSGPLNLDTTSLEGESGSFEYDEQLQILFGMTLYFSIYTIMFNLMNVAEEKRLGTWSRLIVSPIRKWQLYLGHLLYCFLIGYVQIVIVFLLFKYVFAYDLGNNFGYILLVIASYTFAIVALGMLIIGVVKSTQHLQAIIPIVATSMAMLGGAFWPIEIVTNQMLITISQGMPILYGVEALKGVAMYNYGLFELGETLSIMILFGVICMGIGINLMERR
ncbi:ABC transporter permease [Evansella sp. AB-rgal1]|uniref:ABC transporter permease n=1 Tax=Evansella sp. AB-rgal1 TaxID=3242696 RepID=UPI00359DB8B0